MDSSKLKMGSSSSSSSSTDHSLNGLTFGQKIYFEDVGGGAHHHGKSTTVVGGGLLQPAPPKKGRSAAAHGGQRPRCQVEGCQVDLSDAKTYYARHKVCGMHSKSPKVEVAGLEQRFCQQCSRFHQLSEFDQGKRSCHRSLAGHNERRRKPPTGSLLSPCFGSPPSPIFETNSRSGGFLTDFSLYPNLTGRDSWLNTRASDLALSSHSTGTANFLQQPWQSNCEGSSSELLLQGPVIRTGYPGSSISSGDCLTGVLDSSHAPSLLSNRPWDLRNRPSGLGVHRLLNTNQTPWVQPSVPNSAPVSHLSGPSWCSRGTEASISSHEMPPYLGLGHVPQSPNCQYSSQLEAAQPSRRQYLELDEPRGYNSSIQRTNWSL